jgi:hypothetical protein
MCIPQHEQQQKQNNAAAPDNIADRSCFAERCRTALRGFWKLEIEQSAEPAPSGGKEAYHSIEHLAVSCPRKVVRCPAKT